MVHIGVTLVIKVDEPWLGPHVLVKEPMPPIDDNCMEALHLGPRASLLFFSRRPHGPAYLRVTYFVNCMFIDRVKILDAQDM